MNNSGRKLVLITGSAGRIGSALAKRLGEKYQIVGFELMKAIYASENEELVPLDVSSEESVNQAFKHIEAFYGKKIASVVHLAAYYSFQDQEYEKYNKITVQGTKHLLKALERFEVEQFIFSSTMLVHKSTKPGEKISEGSLLDGNWAYPQSKIETEEVIRQYSKNIPTVVMRIAGVYDDDCHSIPISNQIQRIYEKSFTAHFFPGNLNCGASFLHMEDLVDLLEKAVDMRNDIPKKVTVLVGEDHTLSTKAIQNTISRNLFGKKIWMIRVPKVFAWIGAFFLCHIPFMAKPFIRPWMIFLADEHYELNISKAKKLFNWKPTHCLEDCLPTMCKDLQKNPVSWYIKNGLKMPKHLKKIAKSQMREKKKEESSCCKRKAS
jgi:nucleoside-diphosphate-sugar epimerase